MAERQDFDLQNKRLLAVDFGLARVGLAVCDSLHIAITPKTTLLYQNEDFWNNFIDVLRTEDIKGIVVGVPYEPNEEHPMREHIDAFLAKLQTQLNTNNFILPIFLQDESYTSREAVNVMFTSGRKKKYRSTRGNTDKIAAALILRDFLECIDVK
jgi:putative Holliday junction resolvase